MLPATISFYREARHETGTQSDRGDNYFRNVLLGFDHETEAYLPEGPEATDNRNSRPFSDSCLLAGGDRAHRGPVPVRQLSVPGATGRTWLVGFPCWPCSNRLLFPVRTKIELRQLLAGHRRRGIGQRAGRFLRFRESDDIPDGVAAGYDHQ